MAAYLEHGGSKFWEVKVKSKEATVSWGKVGSDGQSMVKAFDKPADAKAFAAKQTDEKRKKGYVDVKLTGKKRAAAAEPPPKATKAPKKAEAAAPPKATKASKATVPKTAVQVATEEAAPLFSLGIVDKASGFSGKGLILLASDTKGVQEIYDVSLVQQDLAKNIDKYYIMQIIVVNSEYHLFTRWGRTGTDGSTQTEGPFELSAQGAAVSSFHKKFKEKTGNDWTQRHPTTFKKKANKYTMVVMDHSARQQKQQAQVITVWEYFVDDGVDGKPTGWYPYVQSASEQMEELHDQYLYNTWLDTRLVSSGAFNYLVDLKEMRQRNTSTGTERQIRRVTPDIASKAAALSAPAAAFREATDLMDEEDEEMDEEDEEMDEEAPGSPVQAGELVVDKLCSWGDAKVYMDYDATLNQTQIGVNANKFYIIQLLKRANGACACWTRWGRVGEDGQNAILIASSLEDGIKTFEKKFKDKTKNNWANRDAFVAHSGKYTLIKLVSSTPITEQHPSVNLPAAKATKSKLSKDVQDLLKLIFSEAKQQLTNTLDVKITSNGLETPLGVLSIAQVEVGEGIVEQALAYIKGKGKKDKSKIQTISSQFYTNIPHKSGRSAPPLLDNLDIVKEKAELCELMRDMVEVAIRSAAGKSQNALHSNDLDSQYDTLQCKVDIVKPNSREHADILKEIKESQERSHGGNGVKVKRVFRLRREEEYERYQPAIGNETYLYHGSRMSNWVGLLSRGILLPKTVVAMGVKRTDEGWLGSGIYFGNADTAAGYAGTSKEGNAYMLMAKTALGKMKDYTKITYGISKPPTGFDSCHGVMGSEFYDDEYVVYTQHQHRLDYLIEFKRT
ncbi:hypothetical protein CYMTET_39079 [Cymbomonas tetramitiformis]|uniref:Poly [ADP-ribose] polymerase n=1 Tax=Cymbomonas tetramitiformis TaxID=36881 RepID=A0AAE0F503_9CHLO|nr:hypothetical protein CYMTET_39079 [Cymbomonas tetramitiformis]